MQLSRRALEVAPRLLGCLLRVGPVALRLTEVEAYEGADDPASHAWRGPTPRTAVMFGPSGHLYVYLSYGVHAAVNIVCGPDQVASAVLLRAGAVVAGLETARARRRPGTPDVALARGPGNLGACLGLRPSDSGTRIDQDRVELRRRHRVPPVSSGPRVGVSRAADRPWRFWVTGDPTVSAYRPSVRSGPSRPGQ